MNIKELLEIESNTRNCEFELSLDKPDPLIVAKKYNDEFISLICACFAYGKASKIVEFLSSLDFSLLDRSEDTIKKEFEGFYYRFQNSQDIQTFFIAIKRLKGIDSLENIFYEGYRHDNNVLEGIDHIIQKIYEQSDGLASHGYTFLVSNPFKRDKKGVIKEIGNAPYKRWNMFLRWMVRNDCLDMGLWTKVDKKDLILPLDTHTFAVSKNLGLLTRDTYDLKSALLITDKLREFDENDPIKYDFALYRIGQEKILLGK
ncbi:TIGR02757 family protein [Arcobacter sp. FWKO B]|uniref:TIGR02757 family protein n=1 Tax=Arcobacter sp. FWKO B TaxID=2593672 RepID=UPI0018A40E6E|nr:TIGR02757 family protein [Arcobacter sp. FWKO B]QOG11640.1 TIGR02757 family protein [Arcobacter sp. FWKO B]